MSIHEKSKSGPTRLVVPKPATEPQLVISWGEAFLERAHRVAHEIEEHVQRLLGGSTNPVSCPSANQSLSNSCTVDEFAETEAPVDDSRLDG